MNLLRAAGYDVYAEYYVNDAGSQIAHLAESVNARYLQLLGKDVDVPDDGYHGYDIVETAKSLIDREGDAYLSMDEEARLKVFKTVALSEKLSILKKDLADFHVTFDNWFSEKSLYPKQVDDALDILKKTDIFMRKTAPGGLPRRRTAMTRTGLLSARTANRPISVPTSPMCRIRKNEAIIN